MGTHKYRLSLSVDHPDADLSFLPAELGLEAKVLYMKGDPRIAPNGRVIGGVHRYSYCSIEFDGGQENSLPDGLRSALAVLKPHKKILPISQRLARLFVSLLVGSPIGLPEMSSNGRYCGTSPSFAFLWTSIFTVLTRTR
jgi:hypothetical protein